MEACLPLRFQEKKLWGWTANRLAAVPRPADEMSSCWLSIERAASTHQALAQSSCRRRHVSQSPRTEQPGQVLRYTGTRVRVKNKMVGC